MKNRIIEIVELGQPQSLIQRENTPITELIKTSLLIEELNEQLRLYGVVSSCVDKDELISDLDDRRAVGVAMNEDMWYFCRKQSAEYLLDKYKLLRK